MPPADLKSKPPIVTSDALAPAGTPPAVIQEITKHVRKAKVALVGHEPNLGELAALLIGARNPLEFKKGAAATVAFTDISGYLKNAVICPSGGTTFADSYTISDVQTKPVCQQVPGTHVLPVDTAG